MVVFFRVGKESEKRESLFSTAEVSTLALQLRVAPLAGGAELAAVGVVVRRWPPRLVRPIRVSRR